MTSTQQARTIAVLGATGNQGQGVVRALLHKASLSFHVRAITRDVESPAAQRLLQDFQSHGRLSLASANIYDIESLRLAFKGAYGVFAVTHNRLPGKTIDTEDQLRHELAAGSNIVDAAEYCKVEHFVMSSLPNLTTSSGGVFTKVYHFDYKHEIEQLARRQLPAVTALIPGLFYTNMIWTQYCRRQEDGSVRFCAPVSGDTLADWVDPGYDVGVFASEVFAAGPQKAGSKTYPVVSPKIPFSQFSEIFSTVTSQPSCFESTTMEEWGATVAATVGKGYEEDIKQMMQWIAMAPSDKICYGTMDAADDTSWQDLGVRASTFEEWMARSNWQGP
ncbi:hypothetical protein BGZ61DRAFT_473850 [Ilyonectria robusta]|uniref:uncharacterized protein n=1 Tax=Ilyonectria robusta TaxID=1079257 RepID=UPI001E8CC549|nr:uncharacterized protein BGZ61DRAFT_473850 [Ilyonectria robusta]KAH8735241.1 hypothetical protein BGZ61DRAFT_473850 [Ilyonectria robusta]